MFGFVRQEIARAAATAATAAAGAAPSPVGPKKSGQGDGESGGADAEAELADKRDVVLSKLPQLMELNKVCVCVMLLRSSFLSVVPHARLFTASCYLRREGSPTFPSRSVGLWRPVKPS